MPPIHYVVKSRLIIKKDTELEFLNLNEEFRHDNPIEAREAAFRFYQNYIDVFLDTKNEKYHSDSQARDILKDYIIIPGTFIARQPLEKPSGPVRPDTGYTRRCLG